MIPKLTLKVKPKNIVFITLDDLQKVKKKLLNIKDNNYVFTLHKHIMCNSMV